LALSFPDGEQGEKGFSQYDQFDIGALEIFKTRVIELFSKLLETPVSEFTER